MAIHWGDLADDGCVGPGSRRYSAVLWDIPWGKSWEDACAETPAPDGSPPAGRTPDHCVTGANEWGQWLVADDACQAHWGTISDSGCSAIGTRKYSSVIWNVPPGQSWEDACTQTPAPGGTPVAGRLPDHCRNTGTNEWGEWDVADGSCTPKWGALSAECVADGEERFSSVLQDIPAGVSWEQTCRATPGPAGTPVAGRPPTRCVNTGFNIWGQWDVSNPQCVCQEVEHVECSYDEDGNEDCETYTTIECGLTPNAQALSSFQSAFNEHIGAVTCPVPPRLGPAQAASGPRTSGRR